MQSTLPCWTSDPLSWQAEVVLLSGPIRCMVSGRRCYPHALKVTSVLDPTGRSIIIDLTVVAALVDSGMTILEAGLADVDDPEVED